MLFVARHFSCRTLVSRRCAFHCQIRMAARAGRRAARTASATSFIRHDTRCRYHRAEHGTVTSIRLRVSRREAEASAVGQRAREGHYRRCEGVDDDAGIRPWRGRAMPRTPADDVAQPRAGRARASRPRTSASKVAPLVCHMAYRRRPQF